MLLGKVPSIRPIRRTTQVWRTAARRIEQTAVLRASRTLMYIRGYEYLIINIICVAGLSPIMTPVYLEFPSVRVLCVIARLRHAVCVADLVPAYTATSGYHAYAHSVEWGS